MFTFVCNWQVFPKPVTNIVTCTNIHICMYAYIHVTITGAFAHMAERKIAYSVITKGGRIGIMTSLNVLMEDIQLLQPTTFSTTPRWV